MSEWEEREEGEKREEDSAAKSDGALRHLFPSSYGIILRTHENCRDSEIGEATTDSYRYENKNPTFHDSRHLD